MSPMSTPHARILGKSLLQLCLIASLFALLGSTANAQTTSITDGSTPLGISPGASSGSYPLSGLDNVNPYGGNLNFHLPLVGIGGRGGAHTTSLLALDTKRWRVNHRIVGGDSIDTPSPNWWDPTPGYGPGLLVGRVSGTGSWNCGYGPNHYMQTLTRLTFTTSDGTEYEFRDQLTAGQPATVPNPCPSGASRGTVFITADGSAATFISDTTVYDGGGGSALFYPSGYLMLRDGTRYRIDGGNVTWMRDRNGNKVSFTYDTSHRVLIITDSLNRQVTFTYANFTSTFSDQITLKGFGGATRTIFVNYANLSTVLRTTNPRSEPASRYQIQTYKNLFPLLNNASSTTNFNPSVVSSITLPNNQQYQFFYNSYAELARVKLPTGGAIEYDYTAGSGVVDGVYFEIYRRVIERRVYPDGVNLESYSTFSDLSSGVATVDQLSGSGTLLSRTKHYFNGDPLNSFFQLPIGYPAKFDGKEYKTESYAADGTTLLRKEEMTWANRAPISWSWSQCCTAEPPNDPRVTDTTATIGDVTPNLISKHVFGYDDSLPYNNRNDVKEYDFGSGSPGALVRETQTTYVTSSTYTDASSGAHIRSLPSQNSIFDASGVERARITYEYDNYASDTNHASLMPRSNISGLDSAFTSSYTTRGNATGSTHYFLVNGSVTGSISNYAQYDVGGNVVKTIDARGYATTFYFDDRFGTPDGEAEGNPGPTDLAGQSSYAFPTKVVNAQNQIVYTQFDYYLGRPVNAEDANGVVFAGYYNDSLDRPTQVIRDYNNLAAKSQTNFSYDDTNRILTTKSDFSALNDNLLRSDTLYDGLGRLTETRAYENTTQYITVKQVPFTVLQDPDTSAWVAASQSSNPYRTYLNESPVWTTIFSDALGRATKVRTPDNAITRTSYSGNTVTGTDQSGKSRKSVTDALGRLTIVYEDPSTLSYQTTYNYDVLDDMVTVNQGSQTRTFVYDSLKRLTSATNPENGTESYVYNNNGNLTSKTDARSITTTIAYDSLNRPTSKTYQNDPSGTPAVNYFYDSQTLPAGAPTFDRGYTTGRLVAVTYGSSSAGNYAGFDALGRVLRKIQQTDSINYLFEATYNVSGAMTAETYPSVPGAGDRRTVTYGFDNAGRLGSLNSNATSYAPAASVANITYASHGALASETYGNSLVQAATYNNRLQTNEIKLGTSGNPTSVLDLVYNYGTTNNNGNVQSYTYTGAGLSYTQSFSYDSLNRLSNATETNGVTTNWSQTNAYDRYGNRQIDYGGGSYNLTFSSTTNRITTAGFSYDLAGNLSNDTIHSYSFNAENKIKTVDANSAYVYDGEGERVRKLVGENTRFVYGIGGQLIAEFDGSTGNLKKEYVYGGVTLITIEATAVNSNGAQYTTRDNLGSLRVITNSLATVVSRHDYMPFGEELGAGVGGRTTAMGFSGTGDNNRKKFTSQERDNETSLDYMHARYHSNVQGRFSSPDSLLGSIDNPQTLNRYAYVDNNPPNSTDPTGHLPRGTTEWSPLYDEGEGGYSSFDDPNNPEAVLMSQGALPEKYEAARIQLYHQEIEAQAEYNIAVALLDRAFGVSSASEVGYGKVVSQVRRVGTVDCVLTLDGVEVWNYGQIGIWFDVTEAAIEYSAEDVGEPRDRTTQPYLGLWGNDERGHLVAKALGGAWQSVNMTSQSRSINRGAVQSFEYKIRSTLTAHKDWRAHLHVSAHYNEPSCDSPTHRTADYYRPYEFRYSVFYTNAQGNVMSHFTMSRTIPNPVSGPF
jgi:RHS repeat-associated protein